MTRSPLFVRPTRSVIVALVFKRHPWARFEAKPIREPVVESGIAQDLTGSKHPFGVAVRHAINLIATRPHSIPRPAFASQVTGVRLVSRKFLTSIQLLWAHEQDARPEGRSGAFAVHVPCSVYLQTSPVCSMASIARSKR